MQDDPDKDYIIEGLTEGFSLVTPSDIIIPQYDAHNYGSAEQDSSKSLLDKLFEAEIQEGKISRVMEKPHCIHAIGAVPKKSGADALRPITDCSRPFDSCLNSHMDYPKQKFKSIDDVCNLMSPGCYFASVDISRAYRAVPVLPGHRRYQGFRWMFGRLDREKYDYFIDNFLVFGLSCAPGIFARISDVICRMMGRRGYYNIVNYLDDYCVVSADREECSRAQLTLIHLLISLGFGVSWSKVCGPSQELTFLGITLDSTVMEARLPPDKLRKLRNILVDFTDRNRATKKELSSLAGILSFCICDKKNESGFIAAILVGFFTFLRKSNLVPESMENFKPGRHLSRGSFAFKGDCAIVKVVETKTIQCRERILYLPLAKCSVTELCPIAAVQVHFQEFITKDKSDPAFQYKGRDGTRTLTHSKLSSTLKEKLTILGIDPNTISMHSLRRGGASYAHQCGAIIELIQAMGFSLSATLS